MKRVLFLLNLFTFLLFERFPTVTSCHWYGSRTNNRKLGKLYMVLKSTKCCLYFTSAFELIDRRAPVDLSRPHKCAFLVIYLI